MSCLVKLTKRQLLKNGGSIIYISTMLTMQEYLELKTKITNEMEFYVQLNDPELHEMFDDDKSFRDSFRQSIQLMNKQERFALAKNTINYRDRHGDSIAHEMAGRLRYTFTIDELIELGNPPNERNQTIAHMMAARDYKFTVDELILLGDSEDSYGWTIAYWMQQRENFFSEDEVNKLKNAGYKTVFLKDPRIK